MSRLIAITFRNLRCVPTLRAAPPNCAAGISPPPIDGGDPDQRGRVRVADGRCLVTWSRPPMASLQRGARPVAGYQLLRSSLPRDAGLVMTFLGRILGTWSGEPVGSYGPFDASFVPGPDRLAGQR